MHRLPDLFSALKRGQAPEAGQAGLEHKIIVLICLLAAVHVFVYAAAFPFFNNVDELQHFDVVLKYSRGEVPRTMDFIDHQTAMDQIGYGATFFLVKGTNLGELSPQTWKLPAAEKANLLPPDAPVFHAMSYESSQPPLYYASAGIVWRILGALGLDEGQKLYGLRFLNILVVSLLVWLGWLCAKVVFPGKMFPRLALPALIAGLPQSAFYSIQNDVFSPLGFGAAFFGLLRLCQTEAPGWRLGAATGLAFAAAFLTKMTNVPLLAVSGLALCGFAWRLQRKDRLRPALPALAALTVCALLPALCWIGWCRSHFGDFTGSRDKLLFLGWTAKPLVAWFQHPIFTAAGAWTFLSAFLSQFWQGEISWHDQVLCLPGVKVFYDLLTLVVILIAVVPLLGHPAPGFSLETYGLRLAFFLCAAVLAFLIYISIRFDFHNCAYPSSTYPYLDSGRLALGALIPFLLLFVSGLDRALRRTPFPLKCGLLAALLVVMLSAEFVTDLPAFQDTYNWYHF
jgi:hypothetical protein